MQIFKRFALFGLSLCLSLTATYAPAAENDRQDRIEQLQEQVDQQREEIDTLRKNIGHVYKQTIRDAGLIEKYRMGNEAYLRSSYFDMTRKDNDTGHEAYDNAFVNYLDLRFSAEPTEEVQFHGTLTMYKLWGAWNTPQDVRSADFNYSNKPSDTGVKIKRAYADYRPLWLDQKLNLTFGRLPTSGGYLTQYRYNRPAMSSYPDLTFNAESDGLALTYYLGNSWMKSLNLIYARSEDDVDARPFTRDPGALEDIDFYTVQLNASLPFLDASTCIFQWFRVDSLRPTGDDAFNSLLRLNSGNFPVPVTARFPDKLGYVDKFTLQISNDRIFELPIDCFASVAYSNMEPNGRKILINDLPLNSEALPEEMNAAINQILQEIYGNAGPYLGSADNESSDDAWAVYAGLRYTFESDRLNNPKFGVEYFEGSKYWAGLNIAAVDPYQKLNTRGKVWEFYWNQPLVEKALQLRTGYQQISRDYTESLLGGLYGEPKEADEDDSLFYLTLEYIF